MPLDRRERYQLERGPEAENQPGARSVLEPRHLPPRRPAERGRRACWTAHLHALHQGRAEREDYPLCHSSAAGKLELKTHQLPRADKSHYFILPLLYRYTRPFTNIPRFLHAFTTTVRDKVNLSEVYQTWQQLMYTSWIPSTCIEMYSSMA